MNKQQIFDKAYTKIIEQGGPSYVPSQRLCFYRGPDGRKCAVGHFIDDEVASNWEGWAISDLDLDLLEMSETVSDNKALFEALQGAHDNATNRTHGDKSFMRLYKKLMQPIAVTFKLNLPTQKV